MYTEKSKIKVFFNDLDDREVNVNIIVLSHNHLQISKNFLEHFTENLPETSIRLVWVDNGSTDGTVDFLTDNVYKTDKFSSMLVLSPDNLGVIGGRNLGYDLSFKYADKKPKDFKESDHLMFLDNDQYVCPGWLDQHLSVLNNGYDMVGVEAWKLNNMFMPCRKNDKLYQDFSYVGCGGMLIKREVVDSIGMFDIIFNPAYFEDPDFNFRAYKAGFKIGWNFKAKIIHMAHQTLGNIKSTEKQAILQNSWNKFKTKWSQKDIPILKQRDLPEFHQ